uniref:Tetraspanin 4b n=1 Tax=Oryzias melastigma TaxID=30732 RepID=A0A3B3DK79_ORYME
MPGTQRCLCCFKYLMFGFNLIFWLGGCGLFGVGVWLSFTQAEFSSLPLSFPSLSAANLLLVAGGITMVTGFLGCLGALKEQRCLLITFFGILLVLVVTEVTLALVVHIFHDEMDARAQRDLKEGMETYVSNPELKKSWDFVQKKFKCCGATNKTDWYGVLNGTLPVSCCSVEAADCDEGWSEPCYQKAKQWLLDNIPSVLVFGCCIGVVQVILSGMYFDYHHIITIEKHTCFLENFSNMTGPNLKNYILSSFLCSGLFFCFCCVDDIPRVNVHLLLFRLCRFWL